MRAAMDKVNEKTSAAFTAWLNDKEDAEKSKVAAELVKSALKDETADGLDYVKGNLDCLVKPSIWIFGGDGWAYDIGYGGLDHVLASGENVNVLVLDTEVYSNTGGQASKSTRPARLLSLPLQERELRKKT